MIQWSLFSILSVDNGIRSSGEKDRRCRAVYGWGKQFTDPAKVHDIGHTNCIKKSFSSLTSFLKRA